MRSDEGTSNEDYISFGDSPKSITKTNRFKIKKPFKPIYKNLGLEPLIVEDEYA
jgi:hypothetical protein